MEGNQLRDLQRLEGLLEAREWPETEIGLSWGTEALKVRKKMLARIKEPGILVMMCPSAIKHHLLSNEPEKFFETDHYKGSEAVLVRLDEIDDEYLGDLLEMSWRGMASKDSVTHFSWKRESPVEFDRIRSIVAKLGLVDVGIVQDRPWVFERLKRGFVWFREPGVWVFRCPLTIKEQLLKERPSVFFENEHFRGYSGLFVRTNKLGDDELTDMILEAFQLVAKGPKKTKGVPLDE